MENHKILLVSCWPGFMWALPSLSLFNPQEVCCWWWKKRKERQSEEKKQGGLSANVSSRHKWRKLPTSLFLIVELWTIHMQPPPPPQLFLFPSLYSVETIYLCGLQMLDPAVRLPGHMDLQLFAWTCCFASKQTLKGCCSIFTFEPVVVCSHSDFATWSGKCLHTLSGEE